MHPVITALIKHVVSMHLEDLLCISEVDELGQINQTFLFQVMDFLGSMLHDQEAVVLLCLVQLPLKRSNPLFLLNLDQLRDLVFALLRRVRVAVRFPATSFTVVRRLKEYVGNLP